MGLWGVIHGIRVFMPMMLKQDVECHVVNTASIAGLMSGPRQAIYKVAKHVVVTLSETLHHELRYGGSKIGVSVFCPFCVKTRIMECQRNRPSELLDCPDLEMEWKANPICRMIWKTLADGVKAGMSCQEAANRVFDGIRENRFYIFTDTDVTRAVVQMRMDDILQGRPPSDPSAALMSKQ